MQTDRDVQNHPFSDNEKDAWLEEQKRSANLGDPVAQDRVNTRNRIDLGTLTRNSQGRDPKKDTG